MKGAAHSRLLMMLAAALGISLSARPAAADPIENFYRGKIITLIVGADVSGEYTTSARLLARHMGKHIPGNPTIIIQNMPGASSINATNYLYEIAAKDAALLMDRALPAG